VDQLQSIGGNEELGQTVAAAGQKFANDHLLPQQGSIL
jgi:hypothetical protein